MDLVDRVDREPAVTTATAENGGWATLFRVGGLAAWGVVAFVPVQLLVVLWPLPANA